MGGTVALQCIIYGKGLQNLVLCLTQKSHMHTSYIFHISQDWVHSLTEDLEILFQKNFRFKP